MTSFLCLDRNWLGLTWHGSEWFVLCLGVENDLVLKWGSKLTWILCDGVLTDRCVRHILEDHSVTVDWVAQWFILYKRTEQAQPQIPVRADWVAQCFIRTKRITEVRGSNPTKVVVQFFSELHFHLFWSSSPHHGQAISKTHERIGRHPSYILYMMLKWYTQWWTFAPVNEWGVWAGSFEPTLLLDSHDPLIWISSYWGRDTKAIPTHMY